MDTQKCQGETSSELKFSLLHRSNVAAAIKPTIAGRSPIKTLCITSDCMYLRKSLLTMSISMKLGSTSAKVVVRLPATPISTLPVSLSKVVYPQYVALLMPIGPGVICDMAMILVNSADDIHLWLATTSYCISEMMPYPPPNPKRPILKNV